MKVRFADDVLAEPSAWRELTRIVDGFLEERHIWDIDDPAVIANSPWLAGEDHYTRGNLDALQKLSVRTLYNPTPVQPDPRPSKAHGMSIVVSLSEAPPGALTPGDARYALERPAYVVVENRDSDKAFLDAMIRAFDRGELRAALDAGWVELESDGGGGAIPKRVRNLVARAGKGPRRILILSDSDRLMPGEHTKTVENIQACGREHGIAAAILHKREIENYLPSSALQRVSRKRKGVYNAFLYLTQEQRDHYDMKKGFGKDEVTGQPKIPRAQAALFAQVPPRILRALCGGFGDKVCEYFTNAADVIDAYAVRNTCASEPSEIEDILDAIEHLI